MLIKDPSRFVVRSADSHDCVQLYQLIKQCHFESKVNDQFVDKLNEYNDKFSTKNFKNQLVHINDQNIHRKENVKVDMNNNVILSAQSTLENFEEFIDCLGFGKCGEKRKVLECLLIEDLEVREIVGLAAYSFGYFSYNGKEIHLNHFYIRPDYRLKGFARLLFSNLIKQAADLDLYKIKIDVPNTCSGFSKFLNKLGAASFVHDYGYNLFKMDLRMIKSRLNDLL